MLVFGCLFFVFLLIVVGFVIIFVMVYVEFRVVKVGCDYYMGIWLEIVCMLMKIIDGCVVGYMIYKFIVSVNIYSIEDGCCMGLFKGELCIIDGIGKFEDVGMMNVWLIVCYFGGFVIFKYWVFYKFLDRSWFISVDLEMKNLWIYMWMLLFKKVLLVMVVKVKVFGYDMNKLEYFEF